MMLPLNEASDNQRDASQRRHGPHIVHEP